MGEDIKPRIGRDLLTLAQASRYAAEERLRHHDWSGLPLPVMGLDLVLEPRYTHQGLSEFRWKECYDEDGVRHAIEEEPPPPPSEFRTVNSWWSDKLQATIKVVKNKEGRAQARFLLENRLSFTLRSLAAADPLYAFLSACARRVRISFAEIKSKRSFSIHTPDGRHKLWEL